METIMILLAILIFFIFQPPTLIKGQVYNVIDFGASRDDNIDSSMSFLRAWETACNTTSNWFIPPTIYVPQGQYLIGRDLSFSGRNCRPMFDNRGIVIRIEGMLVAPDDYMALGPTGRAWISFESVSGLTISGGSLDANGRGLWACKTNKENKCPKGKTTLSITKSRDVTISGLVAVNSQLYHIVIHGCENVLLQGLLVLASGNSPNTDGIHVQLSNHVMISDSRIGTGDDCISVGAGAVDLWVDNVVCGPGHGISIGSLGKDIDEPGVENVAVTRITFRGTQNGVRIKSWGRPSRGYVRNVIFRDIIMDNVHNPIIIDQNYCPYHLNCPGQESGVEVSDVTYENIYGSSATEVAVKFDCSSTNPCNHINLYDVHLTYKGQLATASCANAGGTVVGNIEPISCTIGSD
ncbi:hypothetical protein vseg_012076 [Gypsophila vaccaria]